MTEYQEPDRSVFHSAVQRVRDDLEAGDIDQLSFRLAQNRYSMSARECREAQHLLRREGLLVQKGRQFKAA